MDQFLDGFAVVSILVVAVPLALIILGLAIVFNGRREDDPTGMRTTAVYFGLIDFVALLLLVLGATAVTASLSSLIVDEDDRRSEPSFDALDDFGFETDADVFGDDSGFFAEDLVLEGPDPNDVAIRDSIQAGLVAIPALLVFLFHWRRRKAFVASPGFDQSPALRVDRIYLYAVCFVAALAGAIAVGRGVYDLVRLIIPGVTSDLGDDSLERRRALADLLTMLVLGGASIYIFFWHWGLVSGESEPWRRLGRGSPRTDDSAGSSEPAPPPGG